MKLYLLVEYDHSDDPSNPISFKGITASKMDAYFWGDAYFLGNSSIDRQVVEFELGEIDD